MTRIVPVHVPLVSVVGSACTVRLTPSGVTMPEVGITESHGLSTVATNVVLPPGRPGTKMVNVTGVVLPFGRAIFASFAGTGTVNTATWTTGEYSPARLQGE